MQQQNSMPFVEVIRRDRAAVADCARAAILLETPEYGRLTGEARAAWAAGIDTAIAMFVEGGVDGQPLRDEERTTLAAIGRNRADQGFRLDAIVASIAVAARVVRDWPTRSRRLTDDEERAAFRSFSERTTTFANAVSAAVLDAYVDRAEERATSLEQARARFWDSVLGGRFESEDAALFEGNRVGCDLSVPWTVVLVPATGTRAVADIVAALPGTVVVPMGTADVPHTALAVPVHDGDVRRHARETLQHTVLLHGTWLLWVGPCTGPSELRLRSYTARLLVPHLSRLVDAPAVVDAADLADAVLLATVPDLAARVFADDTLGTIERQPRRTARDWLRTVDALVHNDGSPKAAAQALGVNVKTVRRRMERMKIQAGLFFDSFDVLYRLRLAITLRKLSAVEEGGPVGRGRAWAMQDDGPARCEHIRLQ